MAERCKDSSDSFGRPARRRALSRTRRSSIESASGLDEHVQLLATMNLDANARD